MTLVSPSILSADFAHLGRDVASLEKKGADWVHVDVMDGSFVPNLTIGPDVVKAIRPYTKLPFDVHLMIEKPSMFIEAFADAGADWITVHLEVAENLENLIAQIKKKGKKVGLSLRPGTSVSKIIPFLPMIDLVLVMSVEPGFGGQPFQKKALEKIVALKDLIGPKKVLISVDGGVNAETAPACRLAGADVLVAGSFVFKSPAPAQAINLLKKG